MTSYNISDVSRMLDGQIKPPPPEAVAHWRSEARRCATDTTELAMFLSMLGIEEGQ